MLYRLGSHGPDIANIQTALQSRGLYRGPIDGDYGGATVAAVRAYQQQNGLVVDGAVGSETWKWLFGTDAPASAIASDSLARRCLALTGSFETGTGVPECFCGLSGDFDGQGISFGVLQWNFGQDSLQPLLRDMVARHDDVARGIFGPQYQALQAALGASKNELMTFARSVQHPVTHTVYEPWRGYAKALGRTDEFQQIEVEHANQAFERGVALCGDYGVWSERAVALMFDIVTQNGGINGVTRAQILADFNVLPASLGNDDREVQRLEIVANRRAEAANPQWIDDVRHRKLCIARGAGVVHGIAYQLEGQFGIALKHF